jgi:hypothetical protein
VERIVLRQFDDMDIIRQISRGLDALPTYGTAFMAGPFVREHTDRQVTATGNAISDKVTTWMEPYFEHARVLDVYPDPEADDEQSGRGVFWLSWKTVEDVRIIQREEGYSGGDRFDQWRMAEMDGHGSQLTRDARANVEWLTKDNRAAYVRFFGVAPLSEVAEWDEDAAAMYDALDEESREREIIPIMGIMFGQILSRVTIAPWKKRPMYRALYEEEEGEMWGTGVADNNSTSQKVTNAAFRLFLEGKAWAMLGYSHVDRSKFAASEDFAMYPGKVLQRAPGVTVEEAKQAIDHVTFRDVTDGWQSVIGLAEKFSDDDTGITKYTQGNDSGNLNDTATGITIISNAATQTLKEVLQNVDRHWLTPCTDSLLEWNMQNLKPETVAYWYGQDAGEKWRAIQAFGSYSFMVWKPTGIMTFIQREQNLQKINAFLAQVGANPVLAQKLDGDALIRMFWDLLDLNIEAPILTPEKLAEQAQQLESSVDVQLGRQEKASGIALNAARSEKLKSDAGVKQFEAVQNASQNGKDNASAQDTDARLLNIESAVDNMSRFILEQRGTENAENGQNRES